MRNPPNMSHSIVSPFQLVGPTNLMYPWQFCLPHVTLPAEFGLSKGDNITIQVIESAQHGASLYNVSGPRCCPYVVLLQLTMMV